MKALLFDFDGLLMDTETPEVEIWQQLYEQYGVEFPLQTWIKRVVGSTDDNFNPVVHLSELTGLPLDPVEVRNEARRKRLDIQSRLEVLPGVYELLEQAKHLGLRQVIVSSSPHWWVDGYLDQLKIRDYFEHVICREDAAQPKPAPDLYLEALERLQLPGEECLAFEDSPNGVRAAREAGIRVVGVPNPITRQADPLKAHIVLDSLADLPLEVLLARFDDYSTTGDGS
jgi:HAD superfamily hydrolase (TIGR01509 family)